MVRIKREHSRNAGASVHPPLVGEGYRAVLQTFDIGTRGQRAGGRGDALQRGEVGFRSETRARLGCMFRGAAIVENICSTLGAKRGSHQAAADSSGNASFRIPSREGQQVFPGQRGERAQIDEPAEGRRFAHGSLRDHKAPEAVTDGDSFAIQCVRCSQNAPRITPKRRPPPEG